MRRHQLGVRGVLPKPFTRDEFEGFADDYLGVDIIFWSKDTPWLRGDSLPAP